VLGEDRRAPVGTGRDHLGDLASGDEPDAVEVVHRAVPEEPARGGDVGVRRRHGVEGGRAHRVQPAEPARAHRLPGGDVAGVEAALEPDLDGRLRAADRGQHLDRLVQVGGDGLLHERRQARVDRPDQQLGVHGGRGGDDQGVESGREERVDAVHGPQAELAGHLPGPSWVGVGDDDLLDLGEAPQRLRVPRTDAACSGQSDPHAALLVRPRTAGRLRRLPGSAPT
jgi:hypothetical protein